MKKIFIFNLLFLINLIQSESVLESKTFLDCEYLNATYHPLPSTKMQDSDNLSLVINELKILDAYEIEFSGIRTMAEKRINQIKWDAVHSDWDSWKYKYKLDMISGRLSVDLYVPIADEASFELKILDDDKDGIIKQTSYYYKCQKTSPLFN